MKKATIIIIAIILVLILVFSAYKFTGQFILGPYGKCIDSDNGLNYYEKGITRYENRDIVYTDYCARGAKVKEYYCNPPGTAEGKINSKKEGCLNGCIDGACLK